MASEDWVAAAAEARDAGFTFFDWLGCADDIGRTDTLRVSLVLRDLDNPTLATLTLTTAVTRDGGTLASLRTVFAGAGWHEREAGELFGVTFDGGDPRRLLLAAGYVGTPLRKDEGLGARAAASPTPIAEEVAASAVGGRVRRGRR